MPKETKKPNIIVSTNASANQIFSHQFPKILNPFFHFNTPLDLTGDGQVIVGHYDDNQIRCPLLRTQVRALNLLPGHDSLRLNPRGYILTPKSNQTIIDAILDHLIFPEWKPYLQPFFDENASNIQNILSLTNYVPQTSMILNSFNLVHPARVRFIIVGMRPRPYQDPYMSPGLSLVHVPAEITLRATNPTVQIRRTWESIFAQMFFKHSNQEVPSDDCTDSIDKTLSFLLANGDILLTNLLLTAPLKHDRNENLHFDTWIKITPYILKNYTEQNPNCTVIAIGKIVYTVLTSHKLSVPVYFMRNPTQLNSTRFNEQILYKEIADVLDQSGLRMHLANHLHSHEHT